MFARAIVSPSVRQQFATAAYWTNARSRVMSAIYPAGLPSSLPVVVVETDFAPPSGAAGVWRGTIADAGGRAGGSEIRVWIASPTVAPLGKCVVFGAGHLAAGWDISYTNPDPGQAGIISAILAAGYHVLVADLPNYGRQIQQKAVVNGTLYSTTSAQYYHLPLIGGVDNYIPTPWNSPSLVRLYTDHFSIGMNWVEQNLGISQFALVSHSGGAAATVMLAGLEPRFRVVHLLQGGTPSSSISGSLTDYETFMANDFYTALQGTYGLATCLSGAYPGRVTVVHSALQDQFLGGQGAEWDAFADNARFWLGQIAASYSHQSWNTNHSISPAQRDFVVEHLRANF